MRLLIIGDLNGQVAIASQIARDNGASVEMKNDIDSALQDLRSGKGADLIMIDVQFDVARLINSLVNERINIPVIGCGLDNDTQRAVQAIKAGAKEYIPLPPDEELIAAVLEAISEETKDVIYSSDAMSKIIYMADQVAPSDASVLITGESGTGKEVLAKYIHSKSRRAGKTMISVNCAAIPENLLESELFGHEKGAFTGAVARRLGKFEEADNSTLLLDEISEMDIRLQAKLLRALQEQEIDRVGGSKPVKVNIRIIATSNRNLQEEVKKGAFREDLFFRLNVINLQVPPLRSRKNEIAHFANYFLKKYAHANGLPERPLTPDALSKLENYNWPGNVRELENTMHRAVLLSVGNEINEAAIVLMSSSADNNSVSNTEDGKPLIGRTVDAVERELILGTLDHCLGNRTHAAKILGISIRTLRNKLVEYKKSAVA